MRTNGYIPDYSIVGISLEYYSYEKFANIDVMVTIPLLLVIIYLAKYCRKLCWKFFDFFLLCESVSTKW
ncbi:hypothetical protein [Clostridium sp. Marseille-P299]|uniref:hypothetical protein n=1 Tax=Clostridium sp. Marseille-P299 TaxID=1805477 RepID=UPI001FA7F599|nr:hypothetical protein [Clostridium sp. Marseille-P299]